MAEATAHMGTGEGGGCPLGYGHGKAEKPEGWDASTHNKLLGAFQQMLPSCDTMQAALFDCRAAVAKAGSGHCAPESVAFRGCKNERERKRRKVLQSCAGQRPESVGGGPWLSLEEMFEACLEKQGKATGECEAMVGTFLQCARDSGLH